MASLKFQSTRPLRDGTSSASVLNRYSKISIHPPLAGRDNDQSKDYVWSN